MFIYFFSSMLVELPVSEVESYINYLEEPTTCSGLIYVDIFMTYWPKVFIYLFIYFVPAIWPRVP